MRVAIGQFAAGEEWEPNATACTDLVEEAGRGGADLLVLPEGVLTRFTDDFARVRQEAQPLDGPFVQRVARSTRGMDTTVVLGIHERSAGERVFNTLVTLRDGEVISAYRKLHLYDAFGSVESENVIAGDEVPPLVDCGDFRLGLLTCYDVRFPELARLHAQAGADVLVVPAAWVRGPQKERHWELMVAARAVENTCYVVGAGECSARNIGNSMVVDPMGVPITQLGQRPGVGWATVERAWLEDVRRRLPVLQNRRFSVDASPQYVSAVTPAAS